MIPGSFHQGSQPEVRQPDLAAAVDHYVRRLEIAVEHATLVRRREPGAELPGHVDGGIVRQAADAPQQRRQVLPVDELHREERVAVGLADVVDAADVRMRDVARHAHLAAETLDAVGVGAIASGRNLSATGCPSTRSSAR